MANRINELNAEKSNCLRMKRDAVVSGDNARLKRLEKRIREIDAELKRLHA